MQFHKDGKTYNIGSSKPYNEKTATKDDWRTLPMSEKKEKAEVHLEFTREEFEVIRRGFIPRDMDEKWFIYWDGEYLNFHRSWTGHLIYRLRMLEGEDKVVGKELIIERVGNVKVYAPAEKEVEIVKMLVRMLQER
jgi:hypothetical protein